MKIAISIDSACDLPKEVIKENNIFCMPYFVTMGEEEFRDGINVTSQDLFKYVKEKGILPKTGAPSAEMFKEYFTNILKDYDAVIHISLSDKMTSAFANAKLGVEGMQNVYLVDSMSLSSGIALVALKCVEKVKEGKEPEQIVKELEALRPYVQASFLVDTLKFLYKGGRCSSLALIGATILMLKPQISVINGEMKVTKKYMGGINGCLKKYVEDMLKKSNPDLSVACVTHSSPMAISASICDRLREYGFKQVYDVDASSTISSHCGPGTLGILFINKEPETDANNA